MLMVNFEDPAIAAFCQEVAPEQTPLRIPSRPFEGATANDCFENVRKQIERRGGIAVTGWALWHFPGVLVEAEFHSVWRDPEDGTLIDLNPRAFPCPAISFLPDPSLRYDGRQIASSIKALRDDPLVDLFIHYRQRIFELTNEGDLADVHGAIVISAERRRELDDIQSMLGVVSAQIFSARPGEDQR